MDHPEVIVTDLDGVLTDGVLTIDHLGEKLFKRFHTRDVRAIRELVYNGIEVYIVSADDWGGSRFFARKVGAEFIYLRNKAELIEKIGGRRWWCVGDDAWDIPLLTAAKRAFCPGDADISVRAVKGITILETWGGDGVISELLNVHISCDYS